MGTLGAPEELSTCSSAGESHSIKRMPPHHETLQPFVKARLERGISPGTINREHVTTHYSAPEIGALIEASEKVCALRSRKSPALAIVRARPIVSA
jgi:hypothetical protein